MSEEEALAFEMKMIRHYRRIEDGGCLVNLTDGGEGVSGLKMSPETIAKVAAAGKHRAKTLA